MEINIRRRYKTLGLIVLIFVVAVAIFAYLTNPFVRFSLVRDPFKTSWTETGQIKLEERSPLTLKTNRLISSLATLKSGWHIIGSRVSGGPKAKQQSVDEIIKEIHQTRFDPENPFIISGDHFSVLYPRSLGIFYHSLLDPRTTLDATDWRNRQAIYLKTLAYALEVYSQTSNLSTTIVPVGPRSVALLNFYAPPSDTLYSLLYAFRVLQSTEEITTNYPFNVTSEESLETASASAQLLAQYEEVLVKHYQNYRKQVFDDSTGLVRRGVRLSGTKDIVVRDGAFYDNIIFWKTTLLAQNLGLAPEDKIFLGSLRQKILKTYWRPEGYFADDLAMGGYSSDWLIAFQTGFLDPKKSEDRVYFEKAVEYIVRNAIDQPFGLQYQPEPDRSREYPIVRWFSPSYGTTAIWSNWGMEYIKLSALLYKETGKAEYLDAAQKQLDSYTFNIKRYRGYPEVYDQNGDFYRGLFYKSVRQTGWVVSYEQARAMLNSLKP